ncbi:WDGH domain-containing protein [Nocardiopsis terrae]|uniref:WDGH domain-containing protein n=1 Tax=Streptomyces sp. NPDC057554 TaxID=3350538 RepID=UPI0036B02168
MTDDVYRERARLAAYIAARHPSRIAYNDPESPDWPVLYIDTPASQLTWHLSPDDLDLFAHVPVVAPEHPRARWDGHTTPEKYRRLAALTQALATRTPKDTP